MLKSKLPSFASICSQATGIRAVFTCIAASLGTMRSACAAVPAEELPNSPPKIKNGWPFTISCPVPFSILMCGNSAALSAKTATKKKAALREMLRKVIVKSPPGGELSSLIGISTSFTESVNRTIRMVAAHSQFIIHCEIFFPGNCHPPRRSDSSLASRT